MRRSRDSRSWRAVQRINVTKVVVVFAPDIKIVVMIMLTTLGALLGMLLHTGALKPLGAVLALLVLLMGCHVVAERRSRRKELELVALGAIRTIESTVRVQAMALHVALGLERHSTTRRVDAIKHGHGVEWLVGGS